MAQYRVERVDVSWATVEADSPEEAMDIANNTPDLWDINVGPLEAIEEN